MPSAGILPPGLIMTRSPDTRSSTGISPSIPILSTMAVFGVRSISFFIASEVLPLALDSRNLPKVINVSITPADSK